MKKFLFVFALLFCIGLDYFYYQRISAFGCFDDCFNYGAGYLLTEGKNLYTTIPFNHMPLMAYLSAFIQEITHPSSLYQFLLYHRITIMLISLLINGYLVYRFTYTGLLFVLLYEPTKFYVFGDRFLAESVVSYLLVYLFGLTLEKIRTNKLSLFDTIASGIVCFLVIFLREPFILVALFLYLIILWNKSFYSKAYVLSFSLFLFLSLFLVTRFNIQDFFYNIYSINSIGVIKNETASSNLLGFGLLKALFYPVFILIDGKQTLLRTILSIQSIMFIVSGTFLILKKQYFISFFIISVLFLANLRYTIPGTMFYEAFHQAPWVALFVFANATLLVWIWNAQKKLGYILGILLLISFLLSLISKTAFFYDKVNKGYEFSTNYSVYYVSGQVFKLLANKNDTLFVDGFDELIISQAQLPSPYPYGWYTSFMPFVAKYSNARTQMFVQNPPTFYYGSCPKESLPFRFMPKKAKNNYTQLQFAGNPTCLFVRNDKAKSLTMEEKNRIAPLGFSIP